MQRSASDLFWFRGGSDPEAAEAYYVVCNAKAPSSAVEPHAPVFACVGSVGNLSREGHEAIQKDTKLSRMT